MAYSPIDLSRMGRFQAPKVDFIGNALMGQKMNTQQQALSGLSDPMQRFNLLFNNKTPIDPNAPTGKTESVFLQRQKVLNDPKVKQILSDYSAISEQAIKKRNADPNANISLEMNQMNALSQEYKTLTQQTLSEQFAGKAIEDLYKQRRMIRGEEEYDTSMDQRKKEFSHKLSEDQRDRVEGAIKQWHGMLKRKIDLLNSLDQVLSFVDEAKKGNSIARKNLVAAMSRFGSNEALSDSEMDLLRSGNVLDRLDGFVNKLFGSGAKIGDTDIENAIEILNQMIPTVVGAFTSKVESDAIPIARQLGFNENDPTAIETIKERMTRGIPIPSILQVSPMQSTGELKVNDVKSKLTPQKKQAINTKAPRRKATLADF